MSSKHWIDDCIDWLGYRFTLQAATSRRWIYKDPDVPISIEACLGYYICRTPFTSRNGVLCDDAIQLRERVEHDLKEIRSQNQGNS